LVSVQFLRHSSFQVSFGKTNVLIDPFINNAPHHNGKSIRSPVKESDLKNISLILLTHEHLGHFDKKAVETIAKRDNALVVGHESTLRQLALPRGLMREVKIGEKLNARGIGLEVMIAHHPHAFYPVGYLLNSGKESVFHTGDTDLLDSFSEVDANILMIPIGGQRVMDLSDAVKATKMIKPKYVIPMHYNTFENIKADANEFKHKIDKSVLEAETLIMKPGQKIKI